MRPLASREHPRRLFTVNALGDIRHPRLVDGATYIAACVASLLALDQSHRSGLVPTYWWSVLVMFVACAALLLRRTVPMLTMAAALLSTLASDEATPLIFAAYAVGSYGKSGRWAGIALSGFLYVGTREWVEPSPDVSTMAYDTIVKVCFPAALGALTRRRREVNWLLQQRLVAVEHAVDQAARQAVLDERTRLAFDIHDGLGHRATVLTFQAEALRRTPEMPQKATTLASAVEEGTRGMLRDLRDTLDILRGQSDPMGRTGPAYAQFAAALVANLTAADIDVSFQQSGLARPLAPDTDNVLRSCGREALTNAVKHGHGAPISLQLRFTEQEVCLEVVNGPGTASSAGLPGGLGLGLGLVSMREQTSRAGGHLEAHTTQDGGFRVHITLPAPQDSPRHNDGAVPPQRARTAGLVPRQPGEHPNERTRPTM
ncbi:sensor histidine kinase [Streptomyces olivoreticuli]|uniref:sensor histidine kinase n=1 Tax=Streptomyces olivoreticuli TaxID=68246 RepID=UPI0013C2D709|nr:histidine kinase [Streptomyces olivoreticuli]